MKIFTMPSRICLVGIALCLAGCSAGHVLLLPQAVGPRPHGAQSALTNGTLVVYSGWDRWDTLDSYHPKHTPYAVLGVNGKTLLDVENRTGSFGQQPAQVELAPGKYIVEAEGTNLGLIQLPVVVRQGRTTRVYLDGTDGPLKLGATDADWVQAPNGMALGWKDTEAPAATTGTEGQLTAP